MATKQRKTVLVVGGAGYIGSHMCKMLEVEGYQVVVLDDLSTSIWTDNHRGALVEGDMAERAVVDRICSEYDIDAVIHFAACIDVGESVREPAKYYENNVAKSIGLLNSLVRNNVRRIIFSSTASVYGLPGEIPIPETHPLKPINPYGHSKFVVEQILKYYETAHGMKHVVLRYFNAAGADPEGELGECHEPETHLIPNVLRVANGRLPHLNLLGTNYDTQDGSGVRDYVHVMDLCSGHLLALRDLLSNGPSAVYNLGSEKGFSVLEVVAAVEQVTGKRVRVEEVPPRPGEPSTLVADASKARDYLGWNRQYPDLETIIEHAYAWECKYASRREQLADR